MLATPRNPAPPHAVRIYLLLALMLLLWSANFIFAKLATRELPLVLVLGLRYVLAGLLMLPVYVVASRRPDSAVAPWTLRDLPVLLGCGLFGLVGNQLLFVAGISLTSVTHAAIITALSPILVLLGAAAIGQERITAAKLRGILIAMSGIIVLQCGKDPTGGATPFGDAVMLVSALVFSAFSVFGKGPAARFGSLTLNAVAYFSTGLLALPVLYWATRRYQPWSASPAAWSGILYMALFTSIVGYLIYAYALRHFPASRVAGVTYLQPILASLLAIVVLHERPTASLAASTALVLIGLYQIRSRASR
jgi:drug/metabolite transporter (DMT)-like permease